jgi:hypothetical protein
MVGHQKIFSVLGNRKTVFMRKEHDFYPTPFSIVELMVKEFMNRQDASCKALDIWEPCAGDKRIAEAIKSYAVVTEKTHSIGKRYMVGNVHCTDIQEGQDFFSYKEALLPNIMTNPPFKDIREFIDHAFEIGVEKMALISGERLWACKKGREQFERHKPDLFCMMDFREDYLGKGGSPDRALAINIWDSPCADSCEFKILRKPI